MSSLLERYQTLDRLLGGDHAFISVDSSFPGVFLPAHLLTQASVVLQLSRLFVGGMSLDEERVTANLKFAGRYYECSVPLAAIWGMHSPDADEQYYWPEEMSEPLMRSLVMQMFGGKRPAPLEPKQPELSGKPLLAAAPPLPAEASLSKDAPAETPLDDKPKSKGKKPGKRSHLSVVK